MNRKIFGEEYAAVNKNVPPNVTVAGVPARIINEKGTASVYLIRGDETL